METPGEVKKRIRHPDRVTLHPDALVRLSEWSADLEKHLKGSRITKSDLVNFLILSHSVHLAEREIEQLKSRHFDEVRFAEWAIKELKRAKAEGRSVSLAEVLRQAPETTTDSPKNPSKERAFIKKGLTP